MEESRDGSFSLSLVDQVWRQYVFCKDRSRLFQWLAWVLAGLEECVCQEDATP